jgi:hypothetical protein
MPDFLVGHLSAGMSLKTNDFSPLYWSSLQFVTSTMQFQKLG